MSRKATGSAASPQPEPIQSIAPDTLARRTDGDTLKRDPEGVRPENGCPFVDWASL